MTFYPDFSPGAYPGQARDFPLKTHSHARKCPNSRYVGGLGLYVCECADATRCPGVNKLVRDHYPLQVLPQDVVDRAREQLKRAYEEATELPDSNDPGYQYAAKTATTLGRETMTAEVETALVAWVQAIDAGEDLAEITEFLDLAKIKRDCQTTYERLVEDLSNESQRPAL